MSLRIETSEHVAVIDVTSEVAGAVPDDLESGQCTVYVPHTTAGIVVNENESRLRSDIERWVTETVSDDRSYRHDAIDDNAAAHLRAMLLGESVTVPVADGEPALGTWQSILLIECDGPRTRQLEVLTHAG